jgi:hypothetical protein
VFKECKYIFIDVLVLNAILKEMRRTTITGLFVGNVKLNIELYPISDSFLLLCFPLSSDREHKYTQSIADLVSSEHKKVNNFQYSNNGIKCKDPFSVKDSVSTECIQNY